MLKKFGFFVCLYISTFWYKSQVSHVGEKPLKQRVLGVVRPHGFEPWTSEV